MNFLALCQRLRQECGGNGDGPASVVSQTGENKQYVDWINQAYTEIQLDRPDWDWLWSEGTTNVVEGVRTYSLSGDNLKRDSLSLNGDYLDYVPFAQWDGRDPQSGTPTAYTIRPDHQIQLNVLPNADYVLTYEYYNSVETLAANSDVPALPARFHMLIVYKAMQYYASYENAPEIMQSAMLNYEQMLARMNRDEMPNVILPGAIA